MSSYPTYRPTRPPFRRLRVFAFDPRLSMDIRYALLNSLTLSVPYEPLVPGPISDYLEVIDIDPASNACYPPVDLDDQYVLMQDGLAPSESVPQFHQQMVYAVSRETIENFEATLGHKIQWSTHVTDTGQEQFVQRLRIYPHALRQRNAYYSPTKKALLFGYFPASTTSAGGNLPGGTVFTCLSKDIVTHETTHAILDGLHRYFNEPSNPDVLAFHEAFADIIALFQHFSHYEVVRNQIAETRGDLYSENLLSEFARQFGEATGMRGALRSAIGTDKLLKDTTEPHDRGSILVAAVFKAFTTIYDARSSDLIRLATSGSGVLQPGAIHPDLVDRLAREASTVANHILRMCIRALNYCPPVDISFGEYLRALVTADYDLDQADPDSYRLAMIESFRERGIYPDHVRSLSQESLLWATADHDPILSNFFSNDAFLSAVQKYEQLQKRAVLYRWSDDPLSGNLDDDRRELVKEERDFRRGLEQKISHDLYNAYREKFPDDAALSDYLKTSLNMKLTPDKNMKTIILDRKTGRPEIKLLASRLAYRVDRSGWLHSYLALELGQRRQGFLNPDEQKQADQTGKRAGFAGYDFDFRGGATMLIDTTDGKVKYVITKSIDSDRRLAVQRAYLSGADQAMGFTKIGDTRMGYLRAARGEGGELFALLHSDRMIEEEF